MLAKKSKELIPTQKQKGGVVRSKKELFPESENYKTLLKDWNFHFLREQRPLDPISGWDAALILDALDSHDRGEFELSELLYHAMTRDTRIGPSLRTRGTSIGTFPFSLRMSKEAPERMQRMAKTLEKNWKYVLSKNDRAEVNKRVVMIGFCVAQVQWTILEGQFVPHLIPWTHSSLRYDWNKECFIGRAKVGSDGDDQEVEIRDDGVNWVIFSSGGKQPWLNGAIRTLGLMYFCVSQGYDRWLSYNDMQATAVRAMRTPAIKRGSKEVKKMWEEVRLLRDGDTVLLPQGYDFELFAAAANAYMTFPEIINMANTNISIVILGHNLSQELKNGSFAAMQASLTVTKELSIDDVEGFSETLNAGVMRSWVLANFNPRFYQAEKPLQEYAPVVFFETKDPEDKAKLAETALKNADALQKFIQAAGPRVDALGIDWEEQARRCGIALTIDTKPQLN